MLSDKQYPWLCLAAISNNNSDRFILVAQNQVQLMHALDGKQTHPT